MSNELINDAAIIGAAIILRLWSMAEHKMNGKLEKENREHIEKNSEHIEKIYLLINGEVEKKIAQAKIEATEEERKRHQKK